MAIVDSSGSTVTFNSVSFAATKVSVTFGGGTTSSSDSNIDVSTLDLPAGSDKVYQAPPLAEVASAGGTGVVAQCTIDFLGLEKPVLNTELAINLGTKLGISGTAKCTEYTLDANVNDVLRGTAKFDILSVT